jgi:hypothetical protein
MLELPAPATSGLTRDESAGEVDGAELALVELGSGPVPLG